MPIQSSEGALRLSQELRNGDDLGILDVYPGAEAFASHARMWFSNAAGLLEDVGVCMTSESAEVCMALGTGWSFGSRVWFTRNVFPKRARRRAKKYVELPH